MFTQAMTAAARSWTFLYRRVRRLLLVGLISQAPDPLWRLNRRVCKGEVNQCAGLMQAQIHPRPETAGRALGDGEARAKSAAMYKNLVRTTTKQKFNKEWNKNPDAAWAQKARATSEARSCRLAETSSATPSLWSENDQPSGRGKSVMFWLYPTVTLYSFSCPQQQRGQGEDRGDAKCKYTVQR